MYLYIEVRSPDLKHRLGLRADKLLVLIKNHNKISQFGVCIMIIINLMIVLMN